MPSSPERHTVTRHRAVATWSQEGPEVVTQEAENRLAVLATGRTHAERPLQEAGPLFAPQIFRWITTRRNARSEALFVMGTPS